MVKDSDTESIATTLHIHRKQHTYPELTERNTIAKLVDHLAGISTALVPKPENIHSIPP
jgi:hypothetical protein